MSATRRSCWRSCGCPNVRFRPAILQLLGKDEVTFRVPGRPVFKLSSNQAAETLSSLFSEFLDVYRKLLKPEQKQVYGRLLACSEPPRVSEVIPRFSRDREDDLGCLRALRGTGLIRPEADKRWESRRRGIVTDFGDSLNQ